MKKKMKYGLSLYLFVMIFLFLHGLIFVGVGSAIVLGAISKTGSFETWYLLFPGIGLIGWIGALITLFLCLRRKKRVDWLMQFGQVLYAEFQDITRDSAITINSSRAYVVLYRYIDPVTNAMFQFKSRRFFSFPNGIRKDVKVPVYVNPQDYNEYFLHIEEAF